MGDAGMKEYPSVASEHATLEAVVGGRSIARYGDGELRVALDRSCVSQEADPRLAAELRAILADGRGCLVGIPNVRGNGKGQVTPKQESWLRFATPGYTRLLGKQQFHSSFITRPDSAPWIDTPEYWRRVRDIWRDRNVVLVLGDRRSIRPEEVEPDAASVRVVESTTKHAYREIDQIVERVGRPSGPIVMCLGCTATALAYRFQMAGLWAIDLGHLGMFMRHAGIYRVGLDELASLKYRHELQELHRREEWGSRGDRHAGTVRALIDRAQKIRGVPTEKITVLDYGAGMCMLKEALKPHRVQCYDPGVRELAVLPKPSEVVACTDVLEHVEPTKIDRVVDHLVRLTGSFALLVIATRPARTVLPSGRNAHLIVEDAVWWMDRIRRPDWEVEHSEDRGGKELQVVMRKRRAEDQ